MGKSYTPKHEPNYDVTGVASWYGPKFNGKPTATGEIYDMYDMTAAHKTLPLNSMLFVTNIENGKSIMVRLNDRGPFVGDRIIDLSKASADAVEAPVAAPAPAPVAPYTPPAPAPYTPPAPVAPTAPEAIGESNSVPDGQITLTIKGPIHVARHNGSSAHLIRERLETK